MELKLGANIAALRKAKGMTQEQLAAALGISSPAVSKWETNSSYPDITLLCPLARVLDTNVDMLLNYEKILSSDVIEQKLNEILSVARAGRYQEAGNTLANLLHQYPASVELKYEAAGIFTIFEAVCPDATREEKKNWKMQKKELLYAVYKSGVTEYWQPAATALAAMAVLENDLEEAERLLGELPELTSDPTIIRMELYLRRGERRRAVELIQNRLLQLARQIQTCMTCLLDEKLEPDAERALEIGELSRQFESLFFNRTQLSDALKIDLYRRIGKPAEMIENLCWYLETLEVPMQSLNRTLFSAIEIKPESSEELKKLQQIIYMTMQKACKSDDYKNSPAFCEAMKKLKDSLSERK